MLLAPGSQGWITKYHDLLIKGEIIRHRIWVSNRSIVCYRSGWKFMDNGGKTNVVTF